MEEWEQDHLLQHNLKKKKLNQIQAKGVWIRMLWIFYIEKANSKTVGQYDIKHSVQFGLLFDKLFFKARNVVLYGIDCYTSASMIENYQ